MALTSKASGDKTATGSEDTLTTQTSAGVYILVVDTTNLASGDSVTLKLYTKNQSGDSSVLAYSSVFTGAQDEPQKVSPGLPIDTEIVCTLEQTAGTNRVFPWNLLFIG